MLLLIILSIDLFSPKNIIEYPQWNSLFKYMYLIIQTWMWFWKWYLKVFNIIPLLSPFAKWHSTNLYLNRIEFPCQKMHLVKVGPVVHKKKVLKVIDTWSCIVTSQVFMNIWMQWSRAFSCAFHRAGNKRHFFRSVQL